jgi:selenocysteine lyase/cysteine desulfurase
MEMLHPIGVGWHSVVNESDFQNIRLEFKPSAERWEGGAANFAGISAFGASLELLLKVGVGAIAGRVKALTDHLCSHAASAGLEVFSSRDANDWSGIVSLQSPRHDPQVLKRRCREAGIVVNVRAGRIRVSPHAYNTEEEIDRFLECIRTHGTP